MSADLDYRHSRLGLGQLVPGTEQGDEPAMIIDMGDQGMGEVQKKPGSSTVKIEHPDGTITIAFGQVKPKREKVGWFDNLVDDIDDDQLGIIANRLVTAIQSDDDSRKQWLEDRARGIELLLEENMFITRPVIGEAAAGSPVTIYPGAIDTVDLPNMIKIPRESFLLKVKGESLKDAYIFNGDVIIVNPNAEPGNGKIVAAVLDDGALVKRYFKKGKKIELVSENPEFAPITVDESYPHFHIVGVVVGIYRSMDAKTGRYS